MIFPYFKKDSVLVPNYNTSNDEWS